MSSSYSNGIYHVVELCGPVLAAAYFSNLHSVGDEQGLLLGSMRRDVQESNSDNGIAEQKTIYTIRIESVIICPKHQLFYDNNGHIDESALQDAVGTSDLAVVGWCKFRQNSPSMMSMWEKIILRSLHDKLEHLTDCGIPLFGLFNSSHDRTSTAVLQHTFFHVSPGVVNEWRSIKLSVVNLGRTSTKYKRSISTNQTSIYNTRVNNHRLDFIDDQGELSVHRGVRNLSQSLLTALRDRTAEVAYQERQMQSCHDEIYALRQVLLSRVSANDDSATHQTTQGYSESTFGPSSSRCDLPSSDSNSVDQPVTSPTSGLPADTSGHNTVLSSDMNLIDLGSSLEEIKVPETRSPDVTNLNSVSSEAIQPDIDPQGSTDRDSLEGHFHDHSFECIDISEAQVDDKLEKSDDAFSFVQEVMSNTLHHPSFSPVRTPMNGTPVVKPASG